MALPAAGKNLTRAALLARAILLSALVSRRFGVVVPLLSGMHTIVGAHCGCTSHNIFTGDFGIFYGCVLSDRALLESNQIATATLYRIEAATLSPHS